jgi:putative N6-adenine-specific DNA methylase
VPDPGADLAHREEETGGIEFEGSLTDLYRANLRLRTASRILARLGEFHATVFPELRRKASHLPWEHYLAPGRPVTLRVACHTSRLYHQGAVAERVALAIGDRLGQAPEVQRLGRDLETDPPQLITVRLLDNHCTVSVDSSGPLLHRRGYRLATPKAPLRETLAAAILLASGWDTRHPLLDPLCGSGTIPIEAALLARAIAPGHARRFAFMDWPNFDEGKWRDVLSEGPNDTEPRAPRILASDRDAGALRMAMENAERAGVADAIEFSRRALSAVEPPAESGWVVTNPPYGVRVGEGRDLRNLYARLGQVLRTKCPGWRFAILGRRGALLESIGLPFDREISFRNGGLRVTLATGILGRPGERPTTPEASRVPPKGNAL